MSKKIVIYILILIISFSILLFDIYINTTYESASVTYSNYILTENTNDAYNDTLNSNIPNLPHIEPSIHPINNNEYLDSSKCVINSDIKNNCDKNKIDSYNNFDILHIKNIVMPKDEKTIELIDLFFKMTISEIISTLGNGYEEIETGVENTHFGYYYSRLGLTFVYDYKNKNTLAWIYASNPFEIFGVHSGMTIPEIQANLGNTDISEIIAPFDEEQFVMYYSISYHFGNCIYIFDTLASDGIDSPIITFTIVYNDVINKATNDEQEVININDLNYNEKKELIKSFFEIKE